MAGCLLTQRMGGHLAIPGGAHPGNVWQTAMQAVGVDHDVGELPGLLDAKSV